MAVQGGPDDLTCSPPVSCMLTTQSCWSDELARVVSLTICSESKSSSDLICKFVPSLLISLFRSLASQNSIVFLKIYQLAVWHQNIFNVLCFFIKFGTDSMVSDEPY